MTPWVIGYDQKLSYVICNANGHKYVLWLTLCVTEYWFVLVMRPLSDLIVVGTICRIIWKIYISDIQFTWRSICYSRFINYKLIQETNLNVILIHLQVWEKNSNKRFFSGSENIHKHLLMDWGLPLKEVIFSPSRWILLVCFNWWFTWRYSKQLRRSPLIQNNIT